MTRNTEAAFIVAGTVLASVGVAMVQFAGGMWLDSAVALTDLNCNVLQWRRQSRSPGPVNVDITLC